jgi:hypothetical protein
MDRYLLVPNSFDLERVKPASRLFYARLLSLTHLLGGLFYHHWLPLPADHQTLQSQALFGRLAMAPQQLLSKEEMCRNSLRTLRLLGRTVT